MADITTILVAGFGALGTVTSGPGDHGQGGGPWRRRISIPAI